MALSRVSSRNNFPQQDSQNQNYSRWECRPDIQSHPTETYNWQQTPPHQRFQCFMLRDEIRYRRRNLIVEGNKTSSQGIVGQNLVSEIPQDHHIRLCRGTEHSCYDEACNILIWVINKPPSTVNELSRCWCRT